jgi:hypothetical protein
MSRMAYRRAIIQLKPDCHPSDFIIVKLHQQYLGGRIKKRETPVQQKARASSRYFIYRMKRHTPAARLCYSGRRSVSATQNRFADCVKAKIPKEDTMCLPTVSVRVSDPLFRKQWPTTSLLLNSKTFIIYAPSLFKSLPEGRRNS